MRQFWVVVVLVVVAGCGPTRDELAQARADGLVALGKLQESRRTVVATYKAALAQFDHRIESAIEKIKAGSAAGKPELLAIINERDAVIEKWAADLERRDAVILQQKQRVEEATRLAGPKNYGEVPRSANEPALPEKPQPAHDAATATLDE